VKASVARRARGVALGVVADRLVGEPPLRPHPVAAFGQAMARLEQRTWRPTRLAGTLPVASGLALAAVAGGALGSVAGATYVAVAGRELSRSAARVATALEGHELEKARVLLPELVGRDPAGLDEKEMARAVVESVAENTVDAVVAPALWAAAAGAPGALAYRAVNTLDAMFGHRSARYERYGWASARLDDLAGWIPARVTAALVAKRLKGALLLGIIFTTILATVVNEAKHLKVFTDGSAKIPHTWPGPSFHLLGHFSFHFWTVLGAGSAIAVVFFILIIMLAAVLLYLRQRTLWTEIGGGA